MVHRVNAAAALLLAMIQANAGMSAVGRAPALGGTRLPNTGGLEVIQIEWTYVKLIRELTAMPGQS